MFNLLIIISARTNTFQLQFIGLVKHSRALIGEQLMIELLYAYYIHIHIIYINIDMGQWHLINSLSTKPRNIITFYLPNSNNLISLAAWIPSSFRFFSINFDRAIAARSSADDVHPIFQNSILFKLSIAYSISVLFCSSCRCEWVSDFFWFYFQLNQHVLFTRKRIT